MINRNTAFSRSIVLADSYSYLPCSSILIEFHHHFSLFRYLWDYVTQSVVWWWIGGHRLPIDITKIEPCSGMLIVMENTFGVIPWICWSSTWMPNFFPPMCLITHPSSCNSNWVSLNDIELAVRELYIIIVSCKACLGWAWVKVSIVATKKL